MRRGFVRRHLRSESFRRLFTGGLLIWLFAPGLAFPVMLLITGEVKWKVGEFLGSLALFGGVVGFGLWMLWSGVVALTGLGSHPDLLALSRYGPPDEILAGIDAEVDGKPGALRLGELLKFYTLTPAPGELRGHQVLITASWLIHLWGAGGHRVDVIRLEDLMAAFRSHSVLREQIASTLTLLDRHNVRVQVPGTTAGIRQLLSEVQARAPWALERFDHEIEMIWNADPAKVMAEVLERRESIRRSDLQPGPPDQD